MVSTVDIINAPSSVPAGQTTTFSFEIDLENKTDVDEQASVDITAQLIVNGSAVSSKSTEGKETDIVRGTLSHTFSESEGNGYPRKDETVIVKAQLDYFFSPSVDGVANITQQTRDKNVADDPLIRKSSEVKVDVTKPEDEQEEVITIGDDEAVATQNTLSRTFANKTPFSITNVSYPSTGSGSSGNLGPSSIEFGKYTNPTIAIDTSGRFAKHEIVGGTTVRQKIGEDPINVSINGVCKPQTAKNIDKLRNAINGKIFSDRLPGGSLVVQFGSTSTEPLDDGGAADIEDGKFLYTFQMNCIEVRK